MSASRKIAVLIVALIIVALISIAGIALAFLDAAFRREKKDGFWRELHFCCLLCAANSAFMALFHPLIAFGMVFLVFLPMVIAAGVINALTKPKKKKKESEK